MPIVAYCCEDRSWASKLIEPYQEILTPDFVTAWKWRYIVDHDRSHSLNMLSRLGRDGRQCNCEQSLEFKTAPLSIKSLASKLLTVMPSLPRIFGWIPHPTPPGASPLSILTTNFKSAEKLSPEGSEVVLSPFSSTSSLSPDGGLQPEPEPVRRGDPEWVARPRNPFIIFRCEYSREHAKEGKRVRRLPGSQADKTLSKRAAEAWHQLSAEEKNRFKKLADGEREEHARRYPNYRFRPVKRSTGKNRFVHAPKLQSQPTKPSASETIVAPTPRYPPPPNTTKSSPSSSPLSNSPAPLNMSMVKATRRRSASAPSLPYIQPLNTGFVDTAVLPRLNVKRSRSLMANRTSMTKTGQASTYENLPFDPRLFDVCSKLFK